VGLLLLVGVAPAPAQTAPVGVGTSGGSAELLHLELGSGALDVRLLTESSSTRNDPAAGVPEAVESLAPLEIDSTLLPALDGVSVPPVESRSTGAENSVGSPGVDLGSLAIVPGLLDGTILPATLRSLVDTTGALAGLTGGASDVSVLGGLLSLGELDADLGSAAQVATANGNRSVTLDSIEVLDLDALLQALGLTLADLPLDVAAQLLDLLGLDLPLDFTSPEALVASVRSTLDQIPANLQAQVDTLNAQVDTLQDQLTAASAALGPAQAAIAPLQSQIAAVDAQLAPLQSQLASAQSQLTTATAALNAQLALLLNPALCNTVPVCAAAQTTVNTINATITTLSGQITPLTNTRNGLLTQLTNAQNLVSTLNSTINTLQAQLNALLAQITALLDQVLDLVAPVIDIVNDLLATLAGAPLLTINDISVGTVADARDTVANSVASVTGSIGSITVGGVTVPGVDALAAVDQVTALADGITSTLGGILGTISPSLGSLVDVDVLERTTSIVANGPFVEAIAGITGLRVSLTPPDICALVQGLPVTETLGGLLGQLGQALPPLPTEVTGVLGDLGSVVDCVAGGAPATNGPVVRAALIDGVATALTQPLTLEALTVRSQGAFTPTQSQVTTSTTTSTTTIPGGTVPGGGSPTGGGSPLPRTGGDYLLGAAGLAMLGTALGLRRVIARAHAR
jgi:predicted  nucleic acid-binding Zn-ribbon protein